MMHIAAFLVLSIVVHALLLKAGPRRIHIAALVPAGAILSVLVFQAVAYVDAGSLDPFFPIAVAVQFGVSLLVGGALAFMVRRQRKGA